MRGWMRSGFENYVLWENRSFQQKGFREEVRQPFIPQPMDTSDFDKQYVTVKGVFVEKLPSNVLQLGGCNSATLMLQEGPPPQTLP